MPAVESRANILMIARGMGFTFGRRVRVNE